VISRVGFERVFRARSSTWMWAHRVRYETFFLLEVARGYGHMKLPTHRNLENTKI